VIDFWKSNDFTLESDHQFGNNTKFWTIFKFLEYWNMWNIKYLILNFTQQLFKFGFLHFAWFYLNYIMWLFMFYMYFSKRTSFSMFCILESNSNSTQFPWKKKCQPTTYFWTLKNNHLKIFNMFCRVKIMKPCRKNQCKFWLVLGHNIFLYLSNCERFL